MEEVNENNQVDLTRIFEGLFESSSPAEAEAEILKIASEYSLQLDGHKVKALLLLGIYKEFVSKEDKKIIDYFIDNYLTLQKYNQSNKFIYKILETLSLKKFLGDNWLKVNVEK